MSVNGMATNMKNEKLFRNLFRIEKRLLLQENFIIALDIFGA
jgi:hypothetical protein